MSAETSKTSHTAGRIAVFPIRGSDAMRRVAKWYTILALLILSKAFVPFFSSGGADEGGDPFVLQAVFLGVFVFVAAFMATRPNHTLRVAIAEPLVLLLVAYAALSFLWADAPWLSLSRSLVLIMGTVFGIYLAAAYPLNALLRLFLTAFLIAGFLSAAVAVLVPRVGVEPLSGAWTGLYSRKNVLGRIASLGAIACLPYIIRRSRANWPGIVSFAALFFIIVLSESATSVAVLILLIFVAAAFHMIQHSEPLTLPIIAIGASLLIFAMAAVFFTFSGSLLTALGRDAEANTLVTRLDLWNLVLVKIGQRPLLGYGYGSFWRGWDGPSASIWQLQGWRPNHAHNGFLDIALDLGLLGVAFTVLVLLVALYHAIQLLKRGRSPEYLWPSLLISYLILANGTYSILLSQAVFFWTVFVATTLSAASLLRESSRKQRRTIEAVPALSGPHSAAPPRI